MKNRSKTDEFNRLEALHSYRILDTPAQLEFDDLTHLAAQICETPMAFITLIDQDRQWFKSSHSGGVSETPRAISICAHTILENDSLVVHDASDDSRFADNPIVTGEGHIRFYAGVPLITPQNEALGALCVIDVVPRDLTPYQLETLRRLGRQVMSQLELHRIAVEAAAESQKFWQATLDALPSHVAVLDEKGVIVATNKTWRQFSSDNPGPLFTDKLGANYVLECENSSTEEKPYADQVARGIRDVINRVIPEFRLEHPCHSANHQRWFQVHVSHFEVQGKQHIVISHENITDRKHIEEALQKSNDGLEILASFDALTGIRNRRSFDDRLREEVAHAQQTNKPFSVAIFDIDRFKVYNDTYGHLAGDEVLQEMGQLLRTILRPTDFVARYGGEEFALLFPETGETSSVEAAERLCSAIAAKEWKYSQITASFGISTWSGQDARVLLSQADAALYMAKDSGRNCVCHATAPSN